MDGRAGHGVRRGQRHFHHPFRGHRLPRSHHGLQHGPGREPLVRHQQWLHDRGDPDRGGLHRRAGRAGDEQRHGPLGDCPAPGGRPGPDRLHRVHQRRRAPHSRAVRQAPGGPENVRRPEQQPAHEGEHGRRPARHLRPEHRLSAHHHLELRGHPRRGHRVPEHL